MKFTDFFIRRPVFASVVSLVILLAGLQSIRSLNVRQYPRSDIAVVNVKTRYIVASADLERGFVTHRTMAEPRWLDGTIEPNDRKIGSCFLGVPETVNTGPVGMGRFSTLRSWLSQWSIDDTHAHGEKCAATIKVPFLAIENTADDAVPQPHTGRIYKAAGSKDKTFRQIKGATHYYVAQPELLQEAVDMQMAWMRERKLLD